MIYIINHATIVYCSLLATCMLNLWNTSGWVRSGRVRLFVGNRGSGRVGSGQRFVGSGRAQEKWPVDNSCFDSDGNEIVYLPHSSVLWNLSEWGILRGSAIEADDTGKCDIANVSGIVTSQVIDLPRCHGISVHPSTRLSLPSQCAVVV